MKGRKGKSYKNIKKSSNLEVSKFREESIKTKFMDNNAMDIVKKCIARLEHVLLEISTQKLFCDTDNQSITDHKELNAKEEVK